MTNTLKVLMASAAIGLALTACKGTEKAEQMAAEVVQTITLPSGVTKIDSVVPAKGDQVVIPYTKFVLDNGLTVVLHEDKSDPLALRMSLMSSISKSSPNPAGRSTGQRIETEQIIFKQSRPTNLKKCCG